MFSRTFSSLWHAATIISSLGAAEFRKPYLKPGIDMI